MEGLGKEIKIAGEPMPQPKLETAFFRIQAQTVTT
jgi:hypothetical protein